MKAKRVSVAEAKNRLPALIHEAESSHAPVEITRRGKTVAVLVSSSEYERRGKPKEDLVEALARIRKEYGKDFGFTKEELATLRGPEARARLLVRRGLSVRFLLDTNVVSETIGPTPKRAVLGHLALHQGHVAIASVTWHELHFGVERLVDGRRKEGLLIALDTWQDGVAILPYDAEAAKWHARERARLLARGRVVETFNGQIAAIAATRQLTLVTANAKNFRHYNGLTVVDWSR